MIFLLNSEGRFGHQLSQYVTLMVYAIQYKKPFFYPSFEKKYASFFQSRDIPILSLQPIRFRIICFKIVIYFLRLFKVNEIILFNTYFLIRKKKENELIFQQDIIKLFSANQKYIITDYVFNDIQMILKYRCEIQSMLKLNVCFEKDFLIKKLKKKYEFVIGLHIRRTDFKHFENGKFYFNDDIYLCVLNKFVSILNSNNIAVVICSDEVINTDKFSGFNIFYSVRSYKEDFIILMNCDYLISTRSIFTMMANYLGNNKLYQIIESDNEFQLNDFLSSETLLSKNYDFSNHFS